MVALTDVQRQQVNLKIVQIHEGLVSLSGTKIEECVQEALSDQKNAREILKGILPGEIVSIFLDLGVNFDRDLLLRFVEEIYFEVVQTGNFPFSINSFMDNKNQTLIMGIVANCSKERELECIKEKVDNLRERLYNLLPESIKNILREEQDIISLGYPITLVELMNTIIKYFNDKYGESFTIQYLLEHSEARYDFQGLCEHDEDQVLSDVTINKDGTIARNDGISKVVLQIMNFNLKEKTFNSLLRNLLSNKSKTTIFDLDVNEIDELKSETRWVENFDIEFSNAKVDTAIRLLKGYFSLSIWDDAAQVWILEVLRNLNADELEQVISKSGYKYIEFVERFSNNKYKLFVLKILGANTFVEYELGLADYLGGLSARERSKVIDENNISSRTMQNIDAWNKSEGLSQNINHKG